MAKASNILLEASDHKTAFNEALRILGEATGADRVHLFEIHYGTEMNKPVVSLRYEWSRDPSNSALNDPFLKNVPVEEPSIMWWNSNAVQGSAIKCHVKDLPSEVRRFIEPNGARSIITVPIFVDNVFWGSIGYDYCGGEKVWDSTEESSLFMASASIGAAIKRMYYEEQLQTALRNDFAYTIQNLQNLIFKLKKDPDGQIRFTLFEGLIAKDLGVKTKSAVGKTPQEYFPPSIAEYLQDYLEKALDGEETSFELEYNNRIFYSTMLPVIKNGEINEVVGSTIDITDRKHAEEQIKYYAYYDALTSLPNRMLFSDRLGSAISHAKRNNNIVAVMLLDLDRFKITNDTLGHQVGDQLLKAVAARLSDSMIECDTIARMGGDEFALLLTAFADEKSIAHITRKVLDLFREPFSIPEHELFISTSIGISFFPYDGDDSAELIKNADTAMYRAKENGRNTCQFYTIAMNDRAYERLTMENELRKALEKEEFILMYQPQADLESGRITGCEALIRWRHPGLGIVSPSDFIPLAEETGLIIPMGEWVLHTACSDWKDFTTSCSEDFRISVNISARQFQMEDFTETVNRIIKETGFNPHRLTLEITENSIMQNTLKNLASIRKLKAAGIQISIDDFGTGFSSLSYLKQFDADILKIDKIFISSIISDPSDAALTNAIINMAHNLNLKVVAEGVETEEQLKYLRSVGCDGMQGYLFSRAVTFEELCQMYKEVRPLSVSGKS